MGKQAQTLRAAVQQDHPRGNPRIALQEIDGMDAHAIVGMYQVAKPEDCYAP
jgi:hypothetical protein